MSQGRVSLETYENGWFTDWFKEEVASGKKNPQEIATFTGLTRTTILAYLEGKRHPTLYSFLKILEALGMEMELDERRGINGSEKTD